MFAAETFGVTPDVICIGKGLSRRLRAALGHDLSPADRGCLLGPDRDNPGFVEGHTFEGNPVVCCGRIAVLQNSRA